MTPEQLETVRERCNVEGRICLEANKSCSPELWEATITAPRDRFDLLAHIDALEAKGGSDAKD